MMSKKSYNCGLCKFNGGSLECRNCDGESNFIYANMYVPCSPPPVKYGDLFKPITKSLNDGLKAGLNGSIRAKIENVVFNDPATIVFWSDNTKTIVKTQNGEKFDPEKGLAMAIAKKALGNEGNYFNEIKKWVLIDIARFNANHITNVGEFLVQTSTGEFYYTDEPLLPPNVDFEYSAKRIVIRTKKSKDKKDSK